MNAKKAALCLIIRSKNVLGEGEKGAFEVKKGETDRLHRRKAFFLYICNEKIFSFWRARIFRLGVA